MSEARLSPARRRLASVTAAAYRLVLRAFPASFRRRFGAEMLGVLERRLADPERPALASLRFGVVALIDALRSARDERHGRGRRGEPGGPERGEGRLPGPRRRTRPLGELAQDLRLAGRLARRRPLFTATVVLTLALGIGASAMILTVVNGMFWRPLPYAEPDRLVNVVEASLDGTSAMLVSPPDYLDWRRAQTVFSGMALYWDATFNLSGEGDPARVSGLRVDATLLDVLGVEPALGRGFLPGEDRPGADPVVLLSHGLWQRRLAGDPDVVGGALRLHGVPHTVVGVMPPGFHFREYADLWVPHRMELGQYGRANHSFSVVARLAPGVSPAAARAEMDGIAARLARQYPETNDGIGVRVETLREQLSGGTGTGIGLLVGSVVFVLLLATVNVAGLMVGHAASRQREMAVRSALGASRWRVVRQLLVESVLLAAAGGALGLVLGRQGRDLVLGSVPIELPYWMDFSVDARVLAGIAGVSMGVGVLLGLLPALQVTRPDQAAALRQGAGASPGGRPRQRLRGGLVVAETALAVVLLVGAGLLLRGLLELRAVDPGFETRDLVTMRLSLPAADYEDRARVLGFHDALLEGVRGLPTVQAATLVSGLPLERSYRMRTLEGGGVERRVTAADRVAAPGTFEALGIDLLRGRPFRSDDGAAPGAGVAVVNRVLAERLFGTVDAVGRRLRYWSPEGDREWMTVVGVTAAVRNAELSRPPRPEIWVPLRQAPERGVLLAVRAPGDPAPLVGAIRDVVARLDDDLPVYFVKTMEQILAESGFQNRILTWILTVFAAFALTLAAIGVYGVVAFSVSQRRREFGIRMALGARPADVMGLVMGRGSALTLVGTALGLACAWGLSGFLAAILYEVSPTDPAVFAGVGVLLGLVALAATWWPARRAVRVDPVATLRAD